MSSWWWSGYGPTAGGELFARGHRQDVLWTVFNATIVVPLTVALTLSFSEVVHRSLPWLVVGRIGFVPRWAAIALIFVAMDGLNWFAHSANHRSRVLWRFHELHHSQEDLNVLTVFRTHPLIHVSYLIALIPGIVLVAGAGRVLHPAGGVRRRRGLRSFQYQLGLRALGRIVVSPNYHRIHHMLDGPQDV